MTARANAPKRSPASLAAAHVAACERKANETQAALLEAQNAAVATVPQTRSSEEARTLLAAAAARDAITGGREALALDEQFEHERRTAEEQEQVHRDAASTMRAVAERHVQAEADLAAARAALEGLVTAEATKLAGEALGEYRAALRQLVKAFDSYVVAGTLARGGVWHDLPTPSGYLPTLGTQVTATVAAVEPSRIHWYYQHLYGTVASLAQALRAKIIDGGGAE